MHRHESHGFAGHDSRDTIYHHATAIFRGKARIFTCHHGATQFPDMPALPLLFLVQ